MVRSLKRRGTWMHIGLQAGCMQSDSRWLWLGIEGCKLELKLGPELCRGLGLRLQLWGQCRGEREVC